MLFIWTLSNDHSPIHISLRGIRWPLDHLDDLEHLQLSEGTPADLMIRVESLAEFWLLFGQKLTMRVWPWVTHETTVRAGRIRLHGARRTTLLSLLCFSKGRTQDFSCLESLLRDYWQSWGPMGKRWSWKNDVFSSHIYPVVEALFQVIITLKSRGTCGLLPVCPLNSRPGRQIIIHYVGLKCCKQAVK